MSPSSQCHTCECRLDVNRPAHDRGCRGDRNSYELCEGCASLCHKSDMVDYRCAECQPEEAS